MEEYIDLVEKFLRGQMSLSEEASFKASLDSDKILRSFALLLAVMLKR